MDKQYIQLYSLKDVIVGDFAGTLTKLKQIGYDGVEFFGGFYGGHSAAELKQMMESLGLEALGSHIVTEKIPDQVKYAAELGMPFLIDPMAAIYSYDEAMTAAKRFNEAGRICKEHGISFGYHNHHHEFKTDKDVYLLETVMLNTDPELVFIELDVGWAAYAGADSAALINKYPGRFKLIHFKECGYTEGAGGKDEWNVKSGQGLIDWTEIKKASLAQGTEGFVVEREYDYANDIWKCVEEDHKFLAAL